MHMIVFDKVCKTFPGAALPSVKNLSAEIEKGEFITIVGSSGCGKTTLLKTVNRLITPESGAIYVNNVKNTELPLRELRRGIGYVIQQVGLFPHMTVQTNIALPLKIRKWDKKRIMARVKELLTLVNLDAAEYAGRRPGELSGGQQQRVGLARALAADPPVVLLDEPFGAIDAINRQALQNELLRIHKSSPRTWLFVTHDINEAFKLGNRVMVMDKGELLQFDTPKAIFAQPANKFVQELLESSGVFTNGAGI
jgi:osmoprotectant transport system ATP-binding protein